MTTCIKELHDYSGEETPVHRIALRISSRHSIQRFTNWQPGAMTALRQLTEEYLATSNGTGKLVDTLKELANHLQATGARLDAQLCLYDDLTDEQREVMERSRAQKRRMHENCIDEIHRANGISDLLAAHDHLNYSDAVESDIRYDSLFQEGDEHNAFNLLYRFLDSLTGADLIFEEIVVL